MDEKNPAAQSLANLRWANATKEDREDASRRARRMTRARVRKLTKKEASENASKAALARWAKARKAKMEMKVGALFVVFMLLAAPAMAGDANGIVDRCGALATLTYAIAQRRDRGDDASVAEARIAPSGSIFREIPSAEWKTTLDKATDIAYGNSQLTPEELRGAVLHQCIGPIPGDRQGVDDR